MAKVTNNEMLHHAEGKFGIYSVSQQGEQSILRLRPKASKKKSARQSEYQALVSGLARTFKHEVSMSQKAGWRALGLQMPAKPGSVRSYLTPFGAFMSVNLTASAMDANSPFVLDAPAYTMAPTLPLFTLAATLSSGVFTLTLTAGAAASTPALMGCAPVSIMGQKFTNDQFSLMEVIGTFPAPPAALDLTSAFLETQSVPEVDSQITLLLTPITASGFRGTPKQVTTTVVTA